MGTVRIEYSGEARDVEITGRVAFTGRIRENTAQGDLIMTTKTPGGAEETEKLTWSCSR
jgi:HAMP domain-containing protein